MVSVKDTAITMTRGDTLILQITMEIDDEGHTYTPVEGDVIRFACKKWYTKADVLIEKTIPHETMQLRLDPADTAELPFGDYVYDIQITYADGRVDTFVAKASLRIAEEVA